MSLFGDLTLSPGGLRVPARARYFLWYFNSSFISIPAAVLATFWRIAQHLERDAVLFGCSAGLGFCRWSYVGRLSRGPTLVSLEDFWQGFKQSLEGFSSLAAQGIEELCRTPRGCFSGVSHSRKAFWVFLGFLSRARIQSFSFFRGEQPQISFVS